MHASHAVLLATSTLLLVTCSYNAAAQRNPGGCKGKQSSVIANNGGDCPANCFDTPAGQTILTQGAPGTEWVVGITQCIKPSEAISFISWSPAGPDGECTAGCGQNKVEGVAPGAPFVALPIPYGSCTGAPICLYVHDGTFRRGSDVGPLKGVPESCISSTNQLCEMCGSYLVTPTLTRGEACTDAFTCTTGDTCDELGMCSGTPDNSLCDDNTACTGDVCVADQALATVGVLPADVLVDGSGCGYKATDVAADSCNDGFDCSGDLCVALPSVAAEVGGSPTPDTDGCFFDTVNGPGCPAVRECAVTQCVAGNPLVAPGTGCVNTEVSADGVTGFCAAKYGACAAAMCVDADDVVGYGEGTIQPDGCSLRPAAEADAACPGPMEGGCGEGKCNLAPLADGGGCFINSGPDFNAQCVSPFSCNVGSCEDGTGKCSFNPTNSLCDDDKACTEDICLAGSDPAAQGISAGDVDADTGCGFKKVDSVCEAKYEVCAQPACDPSAASADADGCSVADAAAANAFCTEGLLTDCGVVTCSLGLLPAGSTGTGIEGSGCSLTPDPSSCTAGRPCQIATCSNLGECMYSPSDAFCLDPNNGFAPPGGFGACATASCAPDTSADSTGCVATPVTPNPCDLAPGACGTSECNVATGACDVTSEEQAGQCPECADCVNNQCVGGCAECQKCEAGACVADEGASCSINGGNCFCNAAGVCDRCISECPSCAPELGFRGCAEAVGSPGQATCGAVTCNLLCRLKCNDQRNYAPELCNGAGGCSCKTQPSVLNPAVEFNGPCCRCIAECV